MARTNDYFVFVKDGSLTLRNMSDTFRRHSGGNDEQTLSGYDASLFQDGSQNRSFRLRLHGGFWHLLCYDNGQILGGNRYPRLPLEQPFIVQQLGICCLDMAQNFADYDGIKFLDTGVLPREEDWHD